MSLQVEQILKEKLSENYDMLIESITNTTQNQSDTIPPEDLRRLIRQHGLPLSERHFSKWVSLLCPSLTSGYGLIPSAFSKKALWTIFGGWKCELQAIFEERGCFREDWRPPQYHWEVCMINNKHALMRNHTWYMFFGKIQRGKGTWSLHIELKSTSSKGCCPEET